MLSEHFCTSPYRLTEVLTRTSMLMNEPQNIIVAEYLSDCLSVSAPIRPLVADPSGLTDRSQPIRFSACTGDPANVELVSQRFTLLAWTPRSITTCVRSVRSSQPTCDRSVRLEHFKTLFEHFIHTRVSKQISPNHLEYSVFQTLKYKLMGCGSTNKCWIRCCVIYVGYLIVLFPPSSQTS